MRTIKFRGKRVDNGEWVYGHYVATPLRQSDGFIYFIYEIIKEFDGDTFDTAYNQYLREINPETVGQFTGLTDLNGKEIYEGDILETCDPKATKSGRMYVYFQDGMFCAKVDWSDEIIPLIVYGNEIVKEFIQVIGNIHDNPELLK